MQEKDKRQVSTLCRHPHIKTHPKRSSTPHRPAHLHPLDTAPLHKNHAKRTQARHRHGDVPSLRQGLVVRHLHLRQQGFRHGVLETRRADVQDQLRAGELGHLAADVAHELVVEDVLGDGDHEGAAEGVEEHAHGGGGGDVAQGEDGLHGDEGLLHAEAHAQAEDDLVADPLRVGGGGLEGGEEAGADGGEEGGEVVEGHVVADDGGADAGDDVGRDEREDQGDAHDAGLECGGALDRLEPDGQPEDEDEEGAAQAEGEVARRRHVALLDDVEGDGGVGARELLRDDEDDGQHAREHEQEDDAPVGPRVGDAAPLEAEEAAHDVRDEDASPDHVELAQAT